MDSYHGKRKKYFCPCNFPRCKGKTQRILKDTILKHLQLQGQSINISDYALEAYKPDSLSKSQDNSSSSDDSSVHVSHGPHDSYESNSEDDQAVSKESSDHDIVTEDSYADRTGNLVQENTSFYIPADEKHVQNTTLEPISFSDTSESDSEDDYEIYCPPNKNLESVETWEPTYNNTLFSEGIATKELYTGSAKTILQVLGERFATFTSSNITKGIMSRFISQEKETLPQPNSMPSNYYEAKKLIRPYLLPVKIYDVCPKHCIVYRNSANNKMYSSLDRCPVCDEPRYTSKGVARRQVKYIPVGPRFARIFGNESLAAVLHSHCISSDIENESDYMYDIQDSPKFKNLFLQNGYLAGQKGGIVVGLEADGVAPFHSYNQTYSFTVVTLPVFSLIRSVRMLFRNIFLVMVIPGDSKSEASSEDAYIEILVDELLYLTKFGIVTNYQGAPVKLKIKLLMYILDYPGFCKLFHVSGSGATKGCIWCEISGTYCKHLSKTVYLRNRSYLQDDHFLKLSSSGFPLPSESTSKPRMRSQLQCDSYVEAYTSAKNKAQASSVASATGVKGYYPLMRLPDHDRINQSVPDGMHTIQRCLLNIHNLITGKDDSHKVRLQEKEFGRFENIWPMGITQSTSQLSQSDVEEIAENEDDLSEISVEVENSSSKKRKSKAKSRSSKVKKNTKKLKLTKTVLPPAPYLIKNKDLCNKRFSNIRFPFGTGIKISPIFSSTTTLNSHDWKELACKGILKYCLRDQLGTQQEETLFTFYDCLACLFSEKHKHDELDALEEDFNTTLALIERDFPVSIQNITQHLLHHIVDGIKNFGPLYSTWMYGFERLNGWCSDRAINRRHPESTIIETYLLYDFSQTLAALGIISEKYLDGGEFFDEDKGYHKEIILPTSTINELFNIYCSFDNRLEALWNIYKHEKEQNVTSVSFSEWNPHTRKLTAAERELLKPIVNTALSYDKKSLKNTTTGRISTFSTIRVATEHSDSSLLCINPSYENCHDRKFGRIVKIFQHQQWKKKNTFCIVECLEDVHYDTKLRMWKCQSLRGVMRKTVSLDNLECPVAYSVDQDGIFILA